VAGMLQSKRSPKVIDSGDVEVEVPYQVDEMSHVNEMIEVERVSGLQDLEVELE